MKRRLDRKRGWKQPPLTTPDYEEVSSTEWEFIEVSKEEEDLIYRMHRLVGERWDLIAGRIPGRKAEELERFWIMRHSDGFAQRRKEHNDKISKTNWSLAFNDFN